VGCPVNAPPPGGGVFNTTPHPRTLRGSVQAVGGNTALALLLTVGSNLVGIFTMPFLISAVLGAGSGAVHIAPGPLLRSLIKTILFPLLLGAAACAFVPGKTTSCPRYHLCLVWLQTIEGAHSTSGRTKNAYAQHTPPPPLPNPLLPLPHPSLPNA